MSTRDDTDIINSGVGASDSVINISISLSTCCRHDIISVITFNQCLVRLQFKSME